ncbi:MAG TPA: hypothetical protein VNV66_07030 [Pilimelia sp.]|nr:hypothetical protein [Pilimelia sp.]
MSAVPQPGPRPPQPPSGPLRYRFGGLLLDSEIELPGFAHRRVDPGPDRPVRFRFRLVRTDAPADADGPVVLGGAGRRLVVRRRPDGGYLLTGPDVAACALLPDRRTLCWHPDRPATAADAEFLVGTVLPRLATVQDGLVLHAATLATPAGALLLCGRSGAGKTTLSGAVAAEAGWPLLGDDAAALETDGEQVAVRGFNADVRIRLSPEPGAAKRRAPAPEPAVGALPARLIVRLLPGRPTAVARPRPVERLIALRDNLLRLDRTDPDLRVRELACLAAVTGRVPVLDLHHPATGDAVAATAARIADLAAVR